MGALSGTTDILAVEGLGMTYGSGAAAATIVQDLTFSVAQSEFICVVGPSGGGKTTLIRCIAGLQRPTAGSVKLEGKEVRGPSDGVAFVSQDYGRSLMPWLRIRENVTLPLKGKGISKQEMRVRSDLALEQVGLARADAGALIAGARNVDLRCKPRFGHVVCEHRRGELVDIGAVPGKTTCTIRIGHDLRIPRFLHRNLPSSPHAGARRLNHLAS